MAKKKGATAGEKPLRLVVLDSHAIIHRAYHAIPDFSSSKGEPTGALYGLTSMLLKIVDDLKPDFIVAARDLPGSTVRHDLFEAYKATRAKAEPELIDQLGKAPRVFEAFGIPLYEATGYEADDVVGTIVQQVSSRSDVETIIASGDMDTLQLVSPRVSVYTLRKGLSDTILYDEEAVRERFGFAPEHMVDYKALRGDPSDNIPGIKGIGEKTATELIKEFGTVDHLYRSLEEDPDILAKKGFKPRVVVLVKEGKAAATFSRSLAVIRTNVPIRFELPKRKWHVEENAKSIAAMCDELEFRSLKERIRRVFSEDGTESGPTIAQQAVDSPVLAETALALWLLRSDITNPSQDDVLSYAKTNDIERAREAIFADLRAAGRSFEVFEKIERPLIRVVKKMNESGILVDRAYLQVLSQEYGKELGILAGKIYQHAGHEFNINSPKQLGVVLYDELKINPARQKRTAGGARTPKESELEKLSGLHPVISDILAYRELQKLLSTYIEKLPAQVAPDGRLHAEFIQAGTTTGRMSCQNPNLQNIPIKSEYGKRIRGAFTAPKGFLVASLDYSQIELRIAAGLAGDEKLVEIFKSGGGIHKT